MQSLNHSGASRVENFQLQPSWKLQTTGWICLKKVKRLELCFFYFRKAFDSVPHRVLLEKLDDFKLIIYLYSEFIATSQQVVVNGSSSDALPLLSRVPAIGPLLFLFYIDGIKSITLSSHLKLFADSMLLYRHIYQHWLCPFAGTHQKE